MHMNKRLFVSLSIGVLIFLLIVLSSCMLLEEMPMASYETEDRQSKESTVNDATTTSTKVKPQEQSIDWQLTARSLDIGIGERMSFAIPPNGSAHTVWGTGIYTDDSSIGTAAVHMGLITLVDGGRVTIEIREGQQSYEGSTRNGITTTSYGVWDRSYVFIDKDGYAMTSDTVGPSVQATLPTTTQKTEPTPPPAEIAEAIDWGTTAITWSGQIGKDITITLPKGGTANQVWGTGIYTDDSSIGTAAVHMGLISFADGGTVTIRIREGLDDYDGSTAFGVTTQSYDAWGGSFVFIDREGNEVKLSSAPKKTTPSGIFIADTDWSTNATEWSDNHGGKYTLELPPDGFPGPLWGTGTYTDDSSIGTAAVHAGLITFQEGGRVTIEIRDGLDAYDGSTRNGVTSEAYGEWGGSFVFVP